MVHAIGKGNKGGCKNLKFGGERGSLYVRGMLDFESVDFKTKAVERQ